MSCRACVHSSITGRQQLPQQQNKDLIQPFEQLGIGM